MLVKNNVIKDILIECFRVLVHHGKEGMAQCLI